jgi:prepilin-type N-terminal cleavage/methylation domain-containing protein
MCSPFPANHRTRGFTLIELITVIAVIAILMGLLLPALNSAKTAARKSQARSEETALVNAVHAYYTDYGVYPLNQVQAGAGTPTGGCWDTCYGNSYPPANPWYSSADLVDILRAVDDTNPTQFTHHYNAGNQLNTRQVVYFEGSMAKSSTAPRGGLVLSQGVIGPAGQTIPYGAYVDPWGTEYVVFINASYSGSLNQGIPGSAGGADLAATWFYYNGPPVINTAVAAVSQGPDLSWGTAGNQIFQGSDDIATWQ